MKTFLALLSLALLTVTAQAQTLLDSYSGVWYTTAAPTPAQKISGQLNLYFYDNGIVEVRGYYDGQLVDTVYGVHTAISPIARRITFTDSDGWRYTGTLKLGFVSGSFVQPVTRLYRGRFQATRR